MSETPQNVPTDSAPVSRPDEIRAELHIVKEDGPRRPEIQLEWEWWKIGEIAAELSRGENLFQMPNGIATISFKDNRIEAEKMTPVRFCSWLEKRAFLTAAKKEGRGKAKLPEHAAKVILASDEFRAGLRPLNRIFEAPLPVWRERSGERTIELLEPGYDELTKTLVLGTLDFQRDLSFEEAHGFFREIYKDFRWFELSERTGVTPRSMAAQIVATLSPFCVLLFEEEASRLMFVANAPMEGAGKTLLLRMATYPTCGNTGWINSEDKDELNKRIDTALLQGRSLVVFDDCPALSSHLLNMLLTQGVVTVRKMGGNDMPDVRNFLQIYCSGNQLEMRRETQRRAVFVDLQKQPEGFVPERTITSEWLLKPETRSQFLAAMWALVRNWRDAFNCKRDTASTRKSFEDCAGVLGSIVTAAAFGNAFAERTCDFGGDTKDDTMIRFLRSWADGERRHEERRTKELLDAAEAAGVDEELAGPRRSVKAFGKLIGRVSDSPKLIDARGRRFAVVKADGRELNGWRLEFSD